MILKATAANKLARELASLVTVSRERFAAVYDSLVNEGAGKQFKAAVLDADQNPASNDGIAFTRAFTEAIKQKWWKLLVRRGIDQSVLDPSAEDLLGQVTLQRSRRTVGRRPKRKNGHQTVLQAAFDEAEGFVPAQELTDGLTRTIPKICKVHIALNGHSQQGTGFLVSPQTVLTASHVIEPLLQEGTHQIKRNSHRYLHVEFDGLDTSARDRTRTQPSIYGVVDQWLDDHSPCPKSERPTEKGIAANGHSATAPNEQELDFAVIRLKGSPGRDRGVIVLPSEESHLLQDAKMKVLVFQHPKNFPLRVASGTVTRFVGDDEPPLRFRHLANAARGSSGGLCVDDQFRGVGLHQAAILNERGRPVENQAIPTMLIARRISRGFKVDRMLDPLWCLGDSAEPVLGRGVLQDCIWNLVRGEKRVLTVPGVGKQRRGLSFSKQILRFLLPATESVIIELSAQEIKSDAIELATLLLTRCGEPLTGAASFPSRRQAATTQDGWLRDQLLPDLITRLRKVAHGKLIWLVVDGLHYFDVPETEACSFLKELMKNAGSAVDLRFLLLGANKFLAGIPPNLIERDDPRWPEFDDVHRYLQRYCTQEEVSVTPRELRRLSRQVMLTVESAADQDNRWEVAAEHLRHHIVPSLRNDY